MNVVTQWFLLLLDPDAPAVERLPPMGEDQWARWLGLVERHGVAGWFQRNERARASTGMPQWVREELARKHLAAKLRGMRMLAEYERIRALLRTHRIEVRPIKGVDLVQRVYSDPGLRPFRDIDILIRAGDLSKALRLVSELGYSCPKGVLPVSWLRLFHFHTTVVQRANGTMAEFHWALSDRRTLGRARRTWQRLTECPGEGAPGRLTDAQTIVYLAVHGAKHAMVTDRLCRHPRGAELLLGPLTGYRAIWMVDLYIAMQRLNVDVPCVMKAAEALGCLHPVRSVFELGARFFTRFPAGLPAHPVRRESVRERWVKNYIMAQLERWEGESWGRAPWLLRTHPSLQLRPIKLIL